MRIGRVLSINEATALQEKIALALPQLFRRGVAAAGKVAPQAATGIVPAAEQALPWLSRAGTGRLLGAGIGATTMGAAGAAAAGEENRVGGAVGGALAGALLGTGAGQLVTRAGRGQVTRFGQRQLHSMTGYLPRTAEQVAAGQGAFGKGMSELERMDALKRMGFDPARETVQRGLTSIPGTLKALGQKGQRLEAAKGLARDLGAAGLMMEGVSAVPSIAYAAHQRDPESIGYAAGSTLGSLAGAGLPVVGSIAATEGVGQIGKLVGRGVGRVLGMTPPTSTLSGAHGVGDATQALLRPVGAVTPA